MPKSSAAKAKNFNCHVCGKSFITKRVLETHHRKSHVESQPVYECDTCGNVYSTNSTLLRHLHIRHGTPKCTKATNTTWLCDICGKSEYYAKMGFTRHKLLHTKPYVCKICGRGFQTKTFLRDHGPVHMNERNYLCTTCGRTFKQYGTLHNHMRVKHVTHAAFCCVQCTKRFNTRGILKRHVREVHDNVRPFVCIVCGKAFANKTNLRVHLNSHKRNVLQKR